MTRLHRIFALLLLLSLFSSAAFAAGIELVAPRAIAPTAYWTMLPRTAFAGDRFLTVWREQMETLGTHVKGAIADASGAPVTPFAVTIAKYTMVEWLDVVGTGDSFAVFWRERNLTYMADVDRDGRVTRTRTIDVPVHIAGKVAWNGTHFLLAMRLGGEQFNSSQAVLLERDGDVVTRSFINSFGFTFAIVPSSDSFLVLTSGARFFAQRVSVAGVTDTVQLDQMSSEVVAAPTTNGTLVVWGTAHFAPQSELRSAVLPHDGSAPEIRTLMQREGVLAPLELMRDGDGFVLLFSRQITSHARSALATVRLDASGALAGPEVGGAEADTPDATTNGSVFFVGGNTGSQFLPRVSGIVIERNGATREPRMLSLAHARQHQPILEAGNGRILGLFSEHQGDFASIRASLLSPDGDPSPRPTTALSFLTSRDLAWSGTDYLAVHRSNDQLMATRVDENGAPIDAEPIVLASMETYAWWEHVAAVAWVDTQWMVVWPHDDRIFVSFVSPNGVATTPRPLAVGKPPAENTFRVMSAVALAFDGANALLVWNETHHDICYFPICGTGETKTYAARLKANGDVVDAEPLELPAASEHAIAMRSRQFLVAGGSNVSLVDTREEQLRLVKTTRLHGIPGLTDVTFDGRDFLVAVRYHVANWYLRLHRLDVALNDVDTVRGVMTLPPDRFTPPSVAALDPRSMLIGTQEGDPETGARAVVYRDDDLQPLPAPPLAPSNVHTVARAGGGFETTWDAPEGPPVEQYIVHEYHPSGFVWTVRYVGPETRSAITTYRDVRVIARNAGGASDETASTQQRRRRAARK
ncbi:MAG TPA: fibronectin type III domain-containing protein [Thermoanaerobaculia bacterium]|nr:fibronectin type III domain-containing protein [Thermoanaerobaculia bacterium]